MASYIPSNPLAHPRIVLITGLCTCLHVCLLNCLQINHPRTSEHSSTDHIVPSESCSEGLLFFTMPLEAFSEYVFFSIFIYLFFVFVRQNLGNTVMCMAT